MSLPIHHFLLLLAFCCRSANVLKATTPAATTPARSTHRRPCLQIQCLQFRQVACWAYRARLILPAGEYQTAISVGHAAYRHWHIDSLVQNPRKGFSYAQNTPSNDCHVVKVGTLHLICGAIAAWYAKTFQSCASPSFTSCGQTIGRRNGMLSSLCESENAFPAQSASI